MNAQELLKSINDLLKKNEQFLIDHPEAFKLIEDRLYKAVYDPNDEMDDEEFYGQEDDLGLLDDVPEDDYYTDEGDDAEGDDADQWLQEQEAKPEVEAPVEESAQEEKPKEKKVSNSGYRNWQPKDKYEEKHQILIDQHMADGYSHREAERLVGLNEIPVDPYKHKIKPSQPSDKMLSQMKGLAGDWLRNAERKIGESAEAKKNPIKHATSKALSAHEDAHGNFKTAYDDFLSSDNVKELRGRDRAKAIRDFKSKYNEDNPEHREGAIAAADTGKIYGSAMDERKQHIKEGEQSIIDAGKSGGEMSTVGEFSAGASGNMDNMTAQGAAQMAGGAQEEGGYTSGTVKDPAMHFAESNPEYVKSLKDKLASKLKPEQSERLSAITSIRKKGSE